MADRGPSRCGLGIGIQIPSSLLRPQCLVVAALQQRLNDGTSILRFEKLNPELALVKPGFKNKYDHIVCEFTFAVHL
jgi:hypothetical protein